MEQNNHIITIPQGQFFPTAIVVIGYIAYVTAIVFFFNFIYWGIIINGPLRNASDIFSDFLRQDLPYILLSIAIGCFLTKTEKFFSFDPQKKQIQKGIRFFKWEWGKWIDFQPQGKHFAFQRYEETNTFSYGGFFEKTVSQYVYDLRLIHEDNSFESIISASGFNEVAQIVILGKELSEIYDIPFYDYVRELVRNKKIE